VKNLSVARRYARALLLIGKETGEAETYREELAGVVGLLDQVKEFGQVINNPLYGTSTRKNILKTIIEKVNPSPVIKSFMLLLFDKGRFVFLRDVSDFYQKLADELKGVARASLISATELSPETIEKIRKSLSERTKMDIKLDVEQDPGLIGGIVTKIGDLVLDGSIKTQLLNMRESLKRGESV
jgi:F-type H+-transporting ATPase subunit delta